MYLSHRKSNEQKQNTFMIKKLQKFNIFISCISRSTENRIDFNLLPGKLAFFATVLKYFNCFLAKIIVNYRKVGPTIRERAN